MVEPVTKTPLNEPLFRMGLERLMKDVGFPKSLNSFPKRVQRLDQALAADKNLNLGTEGRCRWIAALAAQGLVPRRDEQLIERIRGLLKASVTQSRRVAAHENLKKQEKARKPAQRKLAKSPAKKKS